MKVDLITSWNERCGIAEYAKDLTTWVKNAEFQIHGRPFYTGTPFRGDIVHLNHEGGLMPGWGAEDIIRLRAQGKKTVLTYHNSTAGRCGNGFTAAFDAVIVHQRTEDNFTYIPHGIPVWNKTVEPQMKIGTAGFPTPSKGMLELATVAWNMKVGFMAVCPESIHGDVHSFARQIKERHPQAEIYKTWWPKETVIDKLAECAVVGFCYRRTGFGVSGAVRMGLATRRPTVITRCKMFDDLREYEEELYIVDTPGEPNLDEIQSAVEYAFEENPKVPKRIIEDMNWERCGKLYEEVYKRLMT